MSVILSNKLNIKHATYNDGITEPELKPLTVNKSFSGAPNASKQSFREERVQIIEEHFDSAKCLFCNHIYSNFVDNLTHMLKAHGLFIPKKEQLVVDLETLIAYFHLIISAYFQCLWCGTERQSAEAARQHMTGKGHCRFDISSEDSEFRDFYDFDSVHEEENDNEEEKDIEVSAKRSSILMIQVNGETLHLPSGKVLMHRSSCQPRSPDHRLRFRFNTEGPCLDSPFTRESAPIQSISSVLTRAKIRDNRFSNQLLQLRAEDRRILMHMPLSHQRAVLATQKAQVDRAKKAGNRIQSRVETLGNKALMKYFVPDTPGRSNG